MRMLLLAVLTSLAFVSIGHAQECEHGICAGNQNANGPRGPGPDRGPDWGHGDHGPGNGGGGPGWGHGPGNGGGPGWGHGPGNGGPGWHPGPPAPPPYYPPAPVAAPDYIECDSNGYRQQTCYFNNFRVTGVYLYQQKSASACIQGQSFGIMQGQIWVANGCRALFRIDHY